MNQCYPCQPFDLGYFKCSDCIILPFKTDQSGNWKLIAEWSTAVIELQNALEEDVWISFYNYFNEDSTAIVKIIRPDGSIFAIDVTKDDVVVATYDRFRISIKEVITKEEIPQKLQELCGSDTDDFSEIKICSTF